MRALGVRAKLPMTGIIIRRLTMHTTVAVGMIMMLQSRGILTSGWAVLTAILIILNLGKIGHSNTIMVTPRRLTLSHPLGTLPLLLRTTIGPTHMIIGQQMTAGATLLRTAALAGRPWMTGISTEMYRVGIGMNDAIRVARNGKATRVGTHVAGKIERRDGLNKTDGITLPQKKNK
jgi:hypothetical protein